MATAQISHFEHLIDSLHKQYRGRVFTCYPLTQIIGEEGQEFYSPTTVDSGAVMVGKTISSAIITPGSFTISTTEVGIFDSVARKASFPPKPFAITCKAGQTQDCVFDQYLVVMDAATNPIVVYISSRITPAITLIPSQSWEGSVNLGKLP